MCISQIESLGVQVGHRLCGYDPGMLLSTGPLVSPESELLVVCLCAEWCGVCREYRARFEQVQDRLAGVHFRWVDIEDASDLVDPVGVDDFPTVLILRGDTPVFFGTVRPQAEALERLVRDRRAGAGPAAPIARDVADLALRLRAG